MSYFPWLWAWGGFTIICCRFHIYSRKAGFSVFYYRAVLLFAQIILSDVRIPLVAHHIISLSSLCRPIWKSGLLKCWSGTLCLECVSKIKSVLLIIFHAIYRAVRIQLIHAFYDDNENTYTLFFIIIKSEVWPICHCLWSGYEAMVCTVFLFIQFLIRCITEVTPPRPAFYLSLCKVLANDRRPYVTPPLSGADSAPSLTLF